MEVSTYPHAPSVRCGKRAEPVPLDLRTRTREELIMMETREPVITEALAVIDKALAEMLRRELVSAVEVGDLLLDLRSLLSASVATTDV